MTTPPADSPRSIDRKLLEILVCPKTRVPLRYDAESQELISDAAQLAYPIRDGIPIMLVEEARPLNQSAAPPPAASGSSAEPEKT
ncbi:MAG TPA: Trm112 family protein [Xanthobacteraceae bacterium]|jgi:hypothetical protein